MYYSTTLGQQSLTHAVSYCATWNPHVCTLSIDVIVLHVNYTSRPLNFNELVGYVCTLHIDVIDTHGPPWDYNVVHSVKTIQIAAIALEITVVISRTRTSSARYYINFVLLGRWTETCFAPFTGCPSFALYIRTYG